MGTRTLKVTNNEELLSFIINQTPELQELDLPVQGEGTKKYGELIMNEDRYKNAFINTINLIGLTLIKRNEWKNPWESFTNRGTLKFGQQVREMIQDLAKVFDYNKEYNNKTKFLESFVPDVLTYVHEVNFQKVYATTINEAALLMAFDSEDGLLDFIADTVGNLYETFKYDKYQVDKYQLARRFLQGTVTSVQIENFDNLTPRQILTKMKAYSKSKNKDMEDTVRTVTSLNKHAEEIVNDVRTKSALKKLKVEPERNVSDISTSDLLKYEELKKRYLEENEKMGIAINPSNDKFTEELRTRSNEA